MKKAFLLIVLSALSTVTHTMERDVFSIIKETLGGAEILSKQLNPDKTIIVVLDEIGLVSLWKNPSGDLIDFLETNKDAKAVRFSRDGKKILVTLSGGKTEELAVPQELAGKQEPEMKKAADIPPATLKAIEEFLSGPNIVSRDLSFDRTKILALDDLGVVSLWENPSGSLISFLKTNKDAKTVRFSLDEKKVIITTIGGKTEEFAIPQELLVEKKQPEMKKAAIDPEVLEAIKRSYVGLVVVSASLSPDQKKIVILDDTGLVSLWKNSSGESIGFLPTNKADAKAVRFSRDGKKVIITGGGRTEELTIPQELLVEEKKQPEIKEAAAIDPNVLNTIKGNAYGLTIIDANLSPDKTKIVTLDDMGTITLWKSPSGYAIDFLATNKMNAKSVQFSLDGKKVIITTVRGRKEEIAIPQALLAEEKKPEIKKAATIDPMALEAIKRNLSGAEIIKSSLSRDNKKIAVLDNTGTVSLWENSSGNLIKILAKGKKDVQYLGFNPDGAKVFVLVEGRTEEFPI